jgi:hypothetical protein
MAKPVGVERKRKNNDNKHAHVREEWTKGKKIGRPKQVWVESTISGGPVPEDYDAAVAAITEETIASFVPAHWEKVA